MSQRRAKPVAAFPVSAPKDALHDVHTKQLELGAITVVLHAYPSKLPREEDVLELICRQVAALREFADSFEATLSISTGSLVTKGGES